MQRRGVVAIGFALGCLIFAGCGETSDSSEPASAGGGPLTQEEFVAAADELCAQGDADLDPLEERLEAAIERAEDDPSPDNLGEAAGATRQIAFNAARLVAAIRVLGPPAADADYLGEIFDQLEEGVELMLEIAAAIEDRGAPNPKIGAELEEIEDATFGRMYDYGMEVCGDAD